ncbi:MAG: hypothetical protein ACK4EY_00475 [Flavipsychrobacter sp.]
MTDTEKYFRENYSSLIHIPPHQLIRYEQVYFLKWIENIFTHNNILSQKILIEMRDAVMQKYGCANPDFSDARIKIVELDELKYFQPTIGLSGPKHSLGELVKVVNYKGNDILFNGYHRVSVDIITGRKNITVKYLML